KRSQAYLVTRGGHLKSQGVMRTNEIVLVAEGIKGGLEIEDVLPLPSHEKLSDKRAVKPFIFAHGLRVVRSAVTYRDPQAHQPYRESCVRMSQISAPRTAVVHNHRVGKPIEAKCFGQRWLDRLSCLVRQSFKAQVKARVIVENFTSYLTVSVQPHVAGFPTDAITLAQLRKAHRFFLRQSHKLLAQRHETNHSPRHKLSPLSISGRTMPLVTEKVLPM